MWLLSTKKSITLVTKLELNLPVEFTNPAIDGLRTMDLEMTPSPADDITVWYLGYNIQSSAWADVLSISW
jgi:hypothetical protein